MSRDRGRDVPRLLSRPATETSVVPRQESRSSQPLVPHPRGPETDRTQDGSPTESVWESLTFVTKGKVYFTDHTRGELFQSLLVKSVYSFENSVIIGRGEGTGERVRGCNSSIVLDQATV